MPLPETNPEPHHKSTPAPRRRDATFYLAVLAIAISLVGTIVSVNDNRILRDQQRIMQEDHQIMQDEKDASVWPYLKISRKITQEDSFLLMDVVVENKGVGPALFRVRHSVDGGEKQSMLSMQALMGQITDDFEVAGLTSAQIDRNVLRANENITAVGLKVKFDGNDPLAALAAIQSLTKIPLSSTVEYCSIYGRCWTVGEQHAVPVACTECGKGLEIN